MTRRAIGSVSGSGQSSASALLLCDECFRHFRFHEPECPFCGAEVSSAVRGAPPKAPPAPGASRAQRYAARAVVLASSVSFSCSSASEGTDADSATQSGGSSQDDGSMLGGASNVNGAGANAGGANAGGANSGGANSGGVGGIIQDGGGGDNTGGSLGNDGMACAGAVSPGQPGSECRSNQDCEGAGTFGLAYCVLTIPNQVGCGNPNFLPNECDPFAVDGQTGCTAEEMCRTGVCGETVCVSKCTAESCGEAATCDGSVCVPKTCDQPGAQTCSEGFECDPSAQGASAIGCAAVSCETGYACGENFDCTPGTAGADAHGCLKRACTADSECDCGYCVNANCEATLGFCYEEMAMPYGTVWPDEEFV